MTRKSLDDLIEELKLGYELTREGIQFASDARDARFSSESYRTDIQMHDENLQINPALTEEWSDFLLERGSFSRFKDAPDTYTPAYTLGVLANFLRHPIKTSRGVAYLAKHFRPEDDKDLAKKFG